MSSSRPNLSSSESDRRSASTATDTTKCQGEITEQADEPVGEGYSELSSRRANLGCGTDYIDGFHNVDVRNVAADQNVDLNDLPWPWADDTFDLVLLDNVLEHLDDPQLALTECARVVEIGGEVVVRCPYPFSPGAFRTDHKAFLHPSEFLDGGHYTIPDFELVEWDVTTVRLGRLFPTKESALWLCDTFGMFGISSWEVRLRVREEAIVPDTS
ncbi:methyltransferase domain-containing protein [Salinigranum halophilum]|uniref:methyltransferase domain-containing protein n=1 Tax=Salinigranum halophilum TaxID=2565931 RepID=UPI0010A92BFA|nr:methyltransferase domain-containing protein [Salinigranum halophilum]